MDPATIAAIGSAAIPLLSSIFGKKKAPATVAPREIDLNQEAKKSLEGNLSNQSMIEALLSRANSFSQDEALGLMEKAMPGYGRLSSRLTGIAEGLATNPYELPDDVAKNLERIAGERGIMTGRQGKAGEFSLMRDFGLNSLEYGQSRINQASQLTSLLAGIAPRVNPMSPLSFYVTPGQQAQVAAGNAAGAQAAAQGGANAAAGMSNINNQNMWDAIANAAGTLLGPGTNASGGKKKQRPNPEPEINGLTGDFPAGFGSAMNIFG